MNRNLPPGRRPTRPVVPPTVPSYPPELSRSLRVESVSRLHPPAPLSVGPADTVDEALVALRSARVGCLLVTDRGRLTGIFTERDLLTRVLAPGLPLQTPVGSVMTPDPVTVAARDPIRTAIRRMQRGGYRHLPVVDERGRPVGVVSARDVVRYLVEHCPEIVFNRPPEGQPFPATPEGA